MKHLLWLLLLSSLSISAKEIPTTIVWPSEQNPIVRFTFGKYVKLGSVGSQQSYSVDVTAENLWSKPLPGATFDAYFFSKDKVRIGNGYIMLTNVGLKEAVKFTLHFTATGAPPASLKVVPVNLPKELGPAAPPKKIRVTIFTVPAGAKLRVDGQEAGVTPKQVELGIGKHMLTFSREGYHDGSFPMEVGPDDVSGGSINFELGALAHDTVEMRDGTTLTGDIESMDISSVVVRVGGNVQSIDRNRVNRILLVQREAPAANAIPNAQQ
jgi:hypothetical protein